MKKQWLAAIQRKSFISNINSKVCELHFLSCCFVTESRAYDEKSGTVISIPLQVRKLKQNAVPSIFPEYPKSLTSGNTSQCQSIRISPNTMKRQREEDHLTQAIQSSIVERV